MARSALGQTSPKFCRRVEAGVISGWRQKNILTGNTCLRGRELGGLKFLSNAL
jgi:hypothetical protein